jgi:3',5'-cyclic AMP phosphodiesterase CpdA
MPRILQISDPHMVVPPAKVSGLLDTAALIEDAIDRILAEWDMIGPVDAVLATGDISDDGNAASYDLFRHQMRRLPAPGFVIPGNHDRREAMRSAFADAPYMPTSGKLNWVQDIAGLRMIGLDTLIEGSGGGEIDPDTADFLDRALQTAADRPVLIALHHPPFASGIRFMDDIGLSGGARLETILRATSQPVLVLCGHVHNTIIASVGEKTAISSAALCSTFPTDFRADAPAGFTTRPGGYMIHVVEAGGFRSTAISLAKGEGPFAF